MVKIGVSISLPYVVRKLFLFIRKLGQLKYAAFFCDPGE
jgi:hypothetical protein